MCLIESDGVSSMYSPGNRGVRRALHPCAGVRVSGSRREDCNDEEGRPGREDNE